jgi:hypothetical protein
MRAPRFIAAATVAATIGIASAPATAGTLFFQVSGSPEVAVDFGTVSFALSENADGDAFEVAPSFFVFFDSVFVTLTSPFVDQDVGAGFTTYSYGAGTVTLDIAAHRDDGQSATGQAILPTLPFSFTVCEGCDSLSGGGLAGDFEIEFGNGLIDPQLAALLRIEPQIGPGRIDFGLEDIDGDPASAVRTGFDHRGAAPMQIEVVEAPEPASAWLLLTAGAAWFVRRRPRNG